MFLKKGNESIMENPEPLIKKLEITNQPRSSVFSVVVQFDDGTHLFKNVDTTILNGLDAINETIWLITDSIEKKENPEEVYYPCPPNEGLLRNLRVKLLGILAFYGIKDGLFVYLGTDYAGKKDWVYGDFEDFKYEPYNPIEKME